MSGGTAVGDLDWLLEQLTANTDGVRGAVILSPDGLALGRSPGLSGDSADHLAALAAGAQALADGVGARYGCGAVTQTIIEMEEALLFIVPAGRGTCLTLLADATADAEQIAYEMAVLVKRVGQHMIADPRFPVRDIHDPYGPAAR
jgi:predicted regulator of Ras-like GTPase activity (Roadblock/LC7/MglB family)